MNCKYLTIFCILITLKSEISANIVTCQYDFSDISIFSTKLSDYSCEISLDFDNYKSITEINGEHEESENTDGDVKILQIYSPSKIQALTSVFCDKFNNLHAIKVENVEIKEIIENSLQKCQQLKLLHLNGNEISSIPENFLVKNPNLVEIVISSNQIQTLDKNTFKMQENLQKLFLHNNKIESLPSEIFVNLKNLKKLKLDENKIEFLDADWFGNLESLVVLSINSNKITYLPQSIFVNLNNLQMLHLDDNLLTYLNSNSFGNLDKLSQICVNSNNISAIDPIIIRNSSLSKLRMESNVCYDEIIESRDQMEEKLKNCFDNFESAINAQDESNAGNNATFSSDEILIKPSNLDIVDVAENINENNEEEDATNTATKATTTSTSSSKVEITTVASKIAEKPLNCGKADSSIVDNNDDGSFTRGTYPWSAAVLKLGEKNPCSGVLISDQKVVTAAKCLYRYDAIADKVKEFERVNLMIILGSHNIFNRDEKDRQAIPAKSLYIHKEFDIMADRMDADVAVIVLSKRVEFSKFIQPICLMDLRSKLDEISEGVVVSYGQQNADNRSPTFGPKKVVPKIYNNSICSDKNEAFESVSSNRTFCGGDSKGTGLCNEDIGGGLVVKYEDHFYLRGIVSAVIGAKEGVCDENTYGLFTDVLKFINWIENVEFH